MAETESHKPPVFTIDDLTLDLGTRQVMRGRERLKLPGLTFDLLVALADKAPDLVSHDDLAERVWNGRPVTPETLAQRIKMLRDALGDDAHQPRYVELVRGQGYRLRSGAEALNTTTIQRRTWRGLGIALVAVALIALSVTLLRESPAPLSPSSKTVAVLPFTDRSPDGEQQYLGDGLAEELINQLARLDELSVASRRESFYYRQPNGNLQTIGSALGVAAILDGSVLKVGDQLRVTVQLVDADSGYNLWSAEFDRELKDLIDIQTDIARSVATTLGVKLGATAGNEFPGAGTANVAAYEAFLRGDFDHAVTLDPGYAAAWGRRGLRKASTMWRHSPLEAPGILELAYKDVARAIEINPTNAEAQADFATMIYATMNWERSEEAFRAALSLKRNAYVVGHYANLMMRTGRSARAIDLLQEEERLTRVPLATGILDLNPHFALANTEHLLERMTPSSSEIGLRQRLFFQLNFGQRDALKSAIAALPHHRPQFRPLIQSILANFEDRERLLTILKQGAETPYRTWPEQYHFLALLAAYFDEPDLAFWIFEHEIRNTTIRFGTLWYPVMKDMRKLPAFKQFLRDVKLVGYWRRYGWPDFCRPLNSEDFTCDS